SAGRNAGQCLIPGIGATMAVLSNRKTKTKSGALPRRRYNQRKGNAMKEITNDECQMSKVQLICRERARRITAVLNAMTWRVRYEISCSLLKRGGLVRLNPFLLRRVK